MIWGKKRRLTGSKGISDMTGRHRFLAAYPDMYAWRPFYNARYKYLPMVGRTMLQVSIMFLDSLVWINVNPSDIEYDGPG
jgi:hypothetical protein